MPVPSPQPFFLLRRTLPWRQLCGARVEPVATLHQKLRRSRIFRWLSGEECQALNLLSRNSTGCEARNEKREQKSLSAPESSPQNRYRGECRGVRQGRQERHLRNKVVFAARRRDRRMPEGATRVA